MWQHSPVLERLSSVVQQHDARLVAVAGLICALACYTALTLVARAGKPGKTSSDPWLIAAAVVIGCGVWAVHFVTLLAYQPGLRVGYDAGQALLAAAGRHCVFGTRIRVYRSRPRRCVGRGSGRRCGRVH